ncbi:hypothetical protein J3R82DRAFT_11387 [Butyriboletus roseoflavus]|nr:hypothetical protein J3R82DRAFT_11387 [Butyriboletus roseoflavus]
MSISQVSFTTRVLFLLPSAIAGLDWDHLTQTRAIYRITSKRHKGWSSRVDSELGNYDYLLGNDVRMCERDLTSGRLTMVSLNNIQIDHRHPAVRDDLYAWGSWILDVCSCNRQSSPVILMAHTRKQAEVDLGWTPSST